MTLAVGLLVTTDGEQSGIFAAGTRVRHEAHALEARDLAEVFLHLGDELEVAFRLVGGDEGVDVAELRPAEGIH